MKKLEAAIKEDAVLDFSRKVEGFVAANGVKAALKAFVWAMDKSDPAQDKLAGVLSKLVVD